MMTSSDNDNNTHESHHQNSNAPDDDKYDPKHSNKTNTDNKANKANNRVIHSPHDLRCCYMCHCRPPWRWPCCAPHQRCCTARLPDMYAGIAPPARRRARRVAQTVLATLLTALLFLWMGMKLQERNVARAPDTVYLYTTPKVCGMTVVTTVTTTPTSNNTINNTRKPTANQLLDNEANPTPAPVPSGSRLRQRKRHASETTTTGEQHNIIHKYNDYDSAQSSTGNTSATKSAATATSQHLQIQTFDTAHKARQYELEQQEQDDTTSSSNTFIAHCGDCGACSTPHDIDIYDATQDSLFETSKQCAVQALIWGRATAGACLRHNVGFTSGCHDCWVQNIMCDVRRCLFVCAWHGMFGTVNQELSASGDKHVLNRCTLCDEKLCGPEFLQCAGANRRRSGIVSDIERNQDVEVCRNVDQAEWWRDETLQEMPFERVIGGG